ncbi:Glycosyl hydrolase family 32 domain protein [Reticulomyxa filosa]|uniref:Glycosyl hydrolase family 32 domain protein n=1 Tax=Reticulomyxa filosa TaxID=46433 RepID=X6NCZ9_RETFI|nr:Glycosyl hydrolase family 32 domain protein [Reticulomyxa filosa]|eukprot:ETO23202.1 Glycosyl hydrolase family 32 domain protein [Reticulomyxa filosa]
MSLPRVLQVDETNTSYPRLTSSVIPEFGDILHDPDSFAQIQDMVVLNTTQFLSPELVYGNELDVEIIVEPCLCECGIYVLSDGHAMTEFTKIGVVFQQNTVYVNTENSSLDNSTYKGQDQIYVHNWNGNTENIKLRVIIDHSIIEVFVNNGINVITERVYPTLSSSLNVGLYANNGNCIFKTIQAWNVNAIFDNIASPPDVKENNDMSQIRLQFSLTYFALVKFFDCCMLKQKYNVPCLGILI